VPKLPSVVRTEAERDKLLRRCRNASEQDAVRLAFARRLCDFGVFEWASDGRYPRESAVRVFVRGSDAERFARARGLVVRDVLRA